MLRVRTLGTLAVASFVLLTPKVVPAQTGGHGEATRHAGCSVVIEGEVHAGGRFAAPIGSGLELLMDPVPNGWILRVLPTTGSRPSEDFATLATPPFRSINPLLVTTDFGFRAQDVVGWNPRSFGYLRRRADLPRAEQAFRAVVATPHPTQADELAVVKVVSQAAEGRLEILDARLVVGTADQTAAAGLLATHFLTTAHTILPSAVPAEGRWGRVDWLRFRATFPSVRWTRSGDRCR